MNLLNHHILQSDSLLGKLDYTTLTAIKDMSDRAMSAWIRHPDSAPFIATMTAKKLHQFAGDIAQNPSVSPEILDKVSMSTDATLGLSRNPSTPASVLARLAEHSDVRVLSALAKHPKTPLAALWSIAEKAPVFIQEQLAEHPTVLQHGPGPLLKSKSTQVLKLLARHSKLDQTEILTLWKMGSDVVASLMSNPLLKANSLKAFLPHVDEKGRAGIAANTSAPEALLRELAIDESVLVKRSVAENPLCPPAILDRLSTISRGDVAMGVALNPSTPPLILTSLSKQSQVRIREAVAKHTNTTAEVLGHLAADPEICVRVAVANNQNTPLKVLRRLAGDTKIEVSSAVASNKSMGAIAQLNNFQYLLKSVGIGAFEFYQNHSTTRVTKLLINSKHPAEVAFLFGSGGVGALDVISNLQGAFVNAKFKVDRDGYLMALQSVNQAVHPTHVEGLAVEGVYLKKVIEWFGWPLVLSIVSQFEPHLSKDCIRMLALGVSSLRKDLNREFETMVRTWLTEPKLDLHQKLSAFQRENAHRNDIVPFYQTVMANAVPEANALLDKGWEVNLPMNGRELFAIGDAQSHCVGGKYYADRCRDGSNIIFQLYHNKETRTGYTFQFSRGGRLLQARGFCNKPAPAPLIIEAQRVILHLLHFAKKQEAPRASSVSMHAA